jgi:tRNA A37 N6-isopentenylltransferase MiaA
VITQTDITVWSVSALLAVGVGWSRYAKWKTRDRLVREIAAMDPERRSKFLMRLDPKLAQEMREQLLARFRIMT